MQNWVFHEKFYVNSQNLFCILCKPFCFFQSTTMYKIMTAIIIVRWVARILIRMSFMKRPAYIMQEYWLCDVSLHIHIYMSC